MLNDIESGNFVIETKSGSNGKKKYKAKILNFDSQLYIFLFGLSVRSRIVRRD